MREREKREREERERREREKRERERRERRERKKERGNEELSMRGEDAESDAHERRNCSIVCDGACMRARV
jgi:hypothetical protein